MGCCSSLIKMGADVAKPKRKAVKPGNISERSAKSRCPGHQKAAARQRCAGEAVRAAFESV